VAATVQEQGTLYNALRRSARLFGRPWDAHTYKQGLSFGPQGGIGDVLNLGLWRVWRHCEAIDDPLLQCLAQVHDAILGQYPVAKREAAIAALFHFMAVATPITDILGVSRVCTIPVEVACGGNWGKKSPENPCGMEEVKP
jgi:hypothetical protein